MIWLPFSPSVTVSQLIDAHILLPALLLNEGAHGLGGVWLVKVALRAPCPLCAEERVEKLVLGVLDPVDVMTRSTRVGSENTHTGQGHNEKETLQGMMAFFLATGTGKVTSMTSPLSRLACDQLSLLVQVPSIPAFGLVTRIPLDALKFTVGMRWICICFAKRGLMRLWWFAG